MAFFKNFCTLRILEPSDGEVWTCKAGVWVFKIVTLEGSGRPRFLQISLILFSENFLVTENLSRKPLGLWLFGMLSWRLNLTTKWQDLMAEGKPIGFHKPWRPYFWGCTLGVWLAIVWMAQIRWICAGLDSKWLITMVIVVVPQGSGCGTPSKWPFISDTWGLLTTD